MKFKNHFIIIVLTISTVLSTSTLMSQPYKVLPLTEIKPAGWIKKQMMRDITTGYISVYEQLYHLMSNPVGAIFGGTDRLLSDPKIEVDSQGREFYLDPKGKKIYYEQRWYPGEFDGNYTDAVVRNGFLTGHKSWQEKAKTIIDYVISNQDKDGYIGIYDAKDRIENQAESNNADLWTQTCMLRPILAYYEFTGEKKYLDTVVKAVNNTNNRLVSSGKNYFQTDRPGDLPLVRGLAYFDVLEKLYQLTGDKTYVDFGLKLYSDYNNATNLNQRDGQLANLLDREKMFCNHSVLTAAEPAKVVFWLSALTGDAIYKQAVANYFYKHDKTLSPTGGVVTSPRMSEQVAGNYGSADLRYEYCGITETLITYTSALQKLSNSDMGDAIEKLMFNAAQAARFADGKAIAYMSKDNQYKSLRKDNGRNQYAACHGTGCCNLNAARTMPFYVSNSWMKTADDKALVLMLYGPTEVNATINGVKVKVSETTLYPFENDVHLAVEASSAKEFDILLRNPSWSKNTKVTATGAKVVFEHGFIRVSKIWGKGDKIEITLDAGIEVKKSFNNEMYVKRGALIYALKIQDVKNATTTFLEGRYANYDLFAANNDEIEKYNGYRMLANANIVEDVFFSMWNIKKDSPMFVYKRNQKANPDYPFDEPYGTITGNFIYNGKDAKATLVPIGSTLLRRTTFLEEIDE